MAPLGRPIDAPAHLTHGPVSLRPVRTRDAKALERLLRDNRKWLQTWEATNPNGYGAAPGSVSLKPTIRSMRAQMAAGTGIPFLISFNGEVVGQLSVSEISGGALRSSQLGYWVSEHMAGRGITPTSVALVIDYLFDDVQLHRVEICVLPENEPSLRVVQKLGIRYEGRRESYIHIAGKWRDHECFAVTSDEAPRGMLDRIRRAG